MSEWRLPDLSDLYICPLCGYQMIALYSEAGAHCPRCNPDCDCARCREERGRWRGVKLVDET